MLNDGPSVTRPRRFGLVEWSHQRWALGDYRAGRKTILGGDPPLDLDSPDDWEKIPTLARQAGLDAGTARLCTLDQLRVVRFVEGDQSATTVNVRPCSTVVTMRRGLRLDGRCRPVPLRVYLGAYNACNCVCTYCCAAATQHRPGLFTVEEIDVIARRLYDLGVIEVRLGESGEPTQHPDFAEIARTIKAQGLFLSLNTNGVMRDDLREFIAGSGLVDLVIQSLDGIGQAHDANRGRGSFAEARKTIDAITAADPDVRPRLRFNYVVNSQTQSSLEDLAELASAVGAEIYLLPMRPSGRAIGGFERLLSGLSWEAIIRRMEGLRRRHPGLVIHSTYDVNRPAGDHLVDHPGCCPAGVEGCCISPAVEERRGAARIRMFGCTFLVDTVEPDGSRPFLAETFDDVADFRDRFFDVWHGPRFDVFRGSAYRDAECECCSMLREHRCTGHCAALGYYRSHHPRFNPAVYCGLAAGGPDLPIL